jgi:hypothetical protein
MKARLDENSGGGSATPAPRKWGALRTAVVSDPNQAPAKMLTMADVVLKLKQKVGRCKLTPGCPRDDRPRMMTALAESKIQWRI